MKKSILALGAVAVVGGLGLATSAQAVVALGVVGNNGVGVPTVTPVPTAAGLELNPGSTGHELIVPYYSAQGATNTLLSIVNTDQKNGKAVKVRFRGAANSDDVLDFTLFLSPADVWTANISNSGNGIAHLSTTDNSCTLPAGPISTDFQLGRLQALSPAQQIANTLEGYVEILNMADIPPTVANLGNAATPVIGPNPLFKAIKHVKGVPPCSAAPAWPTGSVNTAGVDPLTALASTDTVTTGAALLNNYGLDAPSGYLTGGWMLINQQTLAQFSGNDVAVRAYSTASGPGAPGATGAGQVVFSPQTAVTTGLPTSVAAWTADPLLTGSLTYIPVGTFTPGAAVIKPYYVDFPDLSSPLLGATIPATTSPGGAALGTPLAEADLLAAALGHTSIENEFINNATGSVPQNTDWIISQPTRRYFAAVDYAGGSNGAGVIVYNDAQTSNNNTVIDTANPATHGLPYAGNLTRHVAPTTPGAGIVQGDGSLTLVSTANGPQACLTTASFSAVFDREETSPSTGGVVFSPVLGTAGTPYCGEVATISWGNSPLNASLTNVKSTTSITAGWGVFATGTPTGEPYSTTAPVSGPDATYGLPLVGFSAESMANQQSGLSYGATLPHRW